MTYGPSTEKKQKGEREKKKRKVEVDTDKLTLKKKKAKGTPSAALGRAPDVEPLPVLGVPPGAALMAIEWRTSLDKQLEAHLLGAEPLATVAQQSQTTASLMAPQGLDMGGFLAGLRKSIPRAGTQQAVVTTPVLRWSKQTWILVPVAESSNDKAPDHQGVIGQAGSEGNSRRITSRGTTAHCIEVTPGEGGSPAEAGGQEPNANGCGSTKGMNGALKQNGDR